MGIKLHIICFSSDRAANSVVFNFQASKHPEVLIKLMCEELKVRPEDILDFELCLADAVPSVSSIY